MSDDFLKKISNKEKDDKSNPFSQVFQEKRESTGRSTQKDKKNEGGIDGIENLGNTGTPSADISLSDDAAKTEDIPAREPAKDNILDKEEKDSSDINIPTNDMTKADIFNDNTASDNDLVINTSSSYNNLDFGESSEAKGFSDDIINKITGCLKENKWQEAIKLIEENKHE